MWIQSYETSRIGKSTNMESKTAIALGWEGRGVIGENWGVSANEYGTFWGGVGDKNILKLWL